MITAKQAAAVLGISETRMCLLLRQGRVRGARKKGRVWMIPITRDGRIKITDKNSGPDGRWTLPHSAKKKKIHVSSPQIRSNKNQGTREPVIIVKIGSKQKIYTNSAEVSGPFRIIYNPDKPLDGEAQVWIETYGRVVTSG